ncbi:hypothetical protein NMY22_g16955 [Coprinellus aureogranulatus]|nr:hypothetical protein NMY22_g16955 [Coprinellus aureogranulatus]
MLDLCRNVENLSLNLDHADYFPDPPYRGVVLPSVRKLYVGWIDRKYVAYEYLQCFKTPVLEELSLEFVENWRNPSDRLGIPERPFTMESVVSMLQQSQCADTLKRVWLHGAHHGDVQHLQIRLPFIRAPHFNVTSYHPKGVVRRTGTWLMTRNL